MNKVKSVLENKCPDCGSLLDFDGEEEIFNCYRCGCGWKIKVEE